MVLDREGVSVAPIDGLFRCVAVFNSKVGKSTLSFWRRWVRLLGDLHGRSS